MAKPKFSRKAKRHAATSAQDKRRQIEQAKDPNPVRVYIDPTRRKR